MHVICPHNKNVNKVQSQWQSGLEFSYIIIVILPSACNCISDATNEASYFTQSLELKGQQYIKCNYDFSFSCEFL